MINLALACFDFTNRDSDTKDRTNLGWIFYIVDMFVIVLNAVFFVYDLHIWRRLIVGEVGFLSTAASNKTRMSMKQYEKVQEQDMEHFENVGQEPLSSKNEQNELMQSTKAQELNSPEFTPVKRKAPSKSVFKRDLEDVKVSK